MDLRQIAPEELKEITRKHRLFVAGEEGGEHANLSNADLRNADLRNADLFSADLRCANLSNADLRNADLFSADLRCANLSNAGLRNADLFSADLRCANLFSADLRCANLRSADLSNADLFSADLSNARGKVLSIGPIGSRHGITYAFWAGNDIQIQCGCFRGTLAQWEDRCKETHSDSAHGQVYAAAAEMIKATAAAYKWAEGK